MELTDALPRTWSAWLGVKTWLQKDTNCAPAVWKFSDCPAMEQFEVNGVSKCLSVPETLVLLTRNLRYPVALGVNLLQLLTKALQNVITLGLVGRNHVSLRCSTRSLRRGCRRGCATRRWTSCYNTATNTGRSGCNTSSAINKLSEDSEARCCGLSRAFRCGRFGVIPITFSNRWVLTDTNVIKFCSE